MQVNAINYYGNLNFTGKRNPKSKDTNIEQSTQDTNTKRFMSKLSGPVAAALFLVPAATIPTGCTYIDVSAHAFVNFPFNPCCDRDTCINDTIYIPAEFEFPKEIEDSLNYWRGDILEVPVEGDDGDLENKALLYLSGKRQWMMDRPEYIKLNLANSRANEANYDHVIADTIPSELRVTKVNPGEITVVRRDGTVTSNVSGLMFNDDGRKTFAHSNGRDSIYVYPKALSGENNGKFVESKVYTRGYLDKNRYGENVLMVTYKEPGDPDYPLTHDHYVDITGMVRDANDLEDMAGISIE